MEYNTNVDKLFVLLCFRHCAVSRKVAGYIPDEFIKFPSLSNPDRLCGLVVRVPGYRFRGPGSIPGATRKKKVVGLERGPLSLVSTTEELLGRKSSGSGLENRE
jgi:hypothetical protein